MQTIEVCLSKLVKQPKFEKSCLKEESRLANVIRFSVETNQSMEFQKTWGYVFGRAFPQKIYRFSMEAIKIEVFLIFLFRFPS